MGFLAEKNNILSNRGNEGTLRTFFETAGFVDIQIFNATIDQGDWREGIFKKENKLTFIEETDPLMKEASRVAVDAFNVAHHVMEAYHNYIPNKEGKEFADQVFREAREGPCRMTFNLYCAS